MKFARQYFAEKYIVLEDNFDLVWWECIDRAGRDWPHMYKVWVTKQVADCCGTNKRLSYWDKNTTSQCSFCKEEENTMHVTRCKHPTRRKLMKRTVREIAMWMIDSRAGMELADIIERYLGGQCNFTLRSCLSRDQVRFVKLVEDTDTLGWDSFVEGWIARKWGKVVGGEHRKMGSTMVEEKGRTKLVDRLLQVTHKQWILPNTEIYYKLPDG